MALMSMLRQSNVKKRKSARVKWCVQEFCCCFFLFLRTCHWCEVVFVLHSRQLGTSLSGTVQVIYSGHLTGGGTRLHLFSFWLSVFILHHGLGERKLTRANPSWGAELASVTMLLPPPRLQPRNLTSYDAGVHTLSVWNLSNCMWGF